MKKMIAFLMILALLPLCAFAEESALPSMKSVGSERYTNTYLGYALDFPTYFYFLGEDVAAEQTAYINENASEDDDTVYDMHLWIAYINDEDYILFEVQLKECTYDSFETEVAMAPQYAEITNAQLKKEGSRDMVVQLHDGVLRDTPMGQMLETAYVRVGVNEDGTHSSETVVYYDFYYNTIEYCFVMEVPDGYFTLEEIQGLLDEMMQTVDIELVLGAA